MPININRKNSTTICRQDPPTLKLTKGKKYDATKDIISEFSLLISVISIGPILVPFVKKANQKRNPMIYSNSIPQIIGTNIPFVVKIVFIPTNSLPSSNETGMSQLNMHTITKKNTIDKR